MSVPAPGLCRGSCILSLWGGSRDGEIGEGLRKALSQHVLHGAAISAVVCMAPCHHRTIVQDGGEGFVGCLNPLLSGFLNPNLKLKALHHDPLELLQVFWEVLNRRLPRIHGRDVWQIHVLYSYLSFASVSKDKKQTLSCYE